MIHDNVIGEGGDMLPHIHRKGCHVTLFPLDKWKKH